MKTGGTTGLATITLAILFLLFPRESFMSTFGGVGYQGKHVSVYKSIIMNFRNGRREEDVIRSRKEALQPSIDSLGKMLDQRFGELVSPASPYRWARGLILAFRSKVRWTSSGCRPPLPRIFRIHHLASKRVLDTVFPDNVALST
jgi:hypothetical protein